MCVVVIFSKNQGEEKKMIIDCAPWRNCAKKSSSWCKSAKYSRDSYKDLEIELTTNGTWRKIPIDYMLLGVPRKLGYRVRYEEGTNLRCREDPDTEDSDDRTRETLSKMYS
ncbi:uncharacterized protein LOC122499762 [Leptopilina heterotoma]|uniref:uncharacterized protein LOC122499762 n=1 Tax=Leptopilina heterotoma TaxID=63436 RepID=UPI001CA92E7F|nr:uncharacterized protein LOC122499762 [Leptopilina heterotoma]